MPRHSATSSHDAGDELGGRSEKVVLLSTELAEQFDVPIEHVTAIDVFLVGRFDPSLEQSRLVPVTDPQQISDYLAANFRSLSKEKLDFLQSFFDFDDNTLQAAFGALLEKFASRVAVQELHQNANTNEHSIELVGKLTRQLHEHAWLLFSPVPGPLREAPPISRPPGPACRPPGGLARGPRPGLARAAPGGGVGPPLARPLPAFPAAGGPGGGPALPGLLVGAWLGVLRAWPLPWSGGRLEGLVDLEELPDLGDEVHGHVVELLQVRLPRVLGRHAQSLASGRSSSRIQNTAMARAWIRQPGNVGSSSSTTASIRSPSSARVPGTNP